MPTVINYAFRLSIKSAIREIHDRFVQLAKNHLDEAVEEGDIPLNTEVAAYAWMGAINEVVIRWIYGRTRTKTLITRITHTSLTQHRCQR